MRVALYLPLDSWRAVAETVSRSGRGDDWVKIGGLKGYMDGSAGSRTAYFFEPYSDSAGYNGLLQHPEADMRRWIGSADSAGLQVAVHAIGDRANAILLSIYDSVTKAHGARGPRVPGGHAPHPRRQESEWVGAGAEGLGGGGPSRVHGRQRLRDVRRGQTGHPGTRC